MRFEWDRNKNLANEIKHGITFEDATAVFEGPILTRDDPRAYGELRQVSLGFLGDAVIVAVVHTDRNGVTRLISARKAKPKERESFNAYLERAASGDRGDP